MSRPKPGEKTEGSGRKPGTPNKSTQDLMAICEARGLNVFEAMVILAIEETDSTKKFDRLEKISKYLYPQRKAIEHSSDEKGFRIIIEDYKKAE